MRTAVFFWGLALAAPLLLLPQGAPPGQAAEAVAEQEVDLVDKVRKSIDEGVNYLKSKKHTDGHWEVNLGLLTQRGGSTALVLLALLQSGVPPSDECIRDGLKYLRGVEPRHTYVVGLQTMVFIQAGQADDRPLIRRNVEWLLKARQPTGWGYEQAGPTPDNSNSQYALLGLHEAIQAGYKVPPKALEEVRQLYLDTQVKGGWAYRPPAPRRGKGDPTLNMTTAGLCNLLITGMDLAVSQAKLRADGSAEKCGEYKENEPVAKALGYVGAAFPAELTVENVGPTFDVPFYGLYGIERAGRLSGQRFFGGHDWYEVGCRFLVSIQKSDGRWEGPVGAIREGQRQLDRAPLIATSFALLFLSKGRTPVLVSKLAYGRPDEQGWNNKRNDARHLVDFASRELFKGRPMAWQAFDVRGRKVRAADRKKLAAELLPSPVVYFNGHDFAPRGEYCEILREYVANGGFLLAENCCGKKRHPGFDRDLRDFVKAVFGPGAELVPVEPGHPVWTASGKFAVSPRDFPDLMCVKQGCKTVMIYSPAALAGYWEAGPNSTDPEFRNKERGLKAFRLGANILAYATGLEPPRPRLTRLAIAAEGEPVRVKRGFLQVAQLMHSGDAQPAPQAMRNLMSEARKAGLDVALTTARVPLTGEDVLEYRFLYMHGRKAFTYDKAALKDLRFCLKSGGLLLADACCGSKAFDAEFRNKFMPALWAKDKLKLEPIPPGDELFGAELNGGTPIRTVRCRRWGADGKVERELRDLPPALEGVKYKGRWVVIYSRYDIGCALERHKSPDCAGHDHDSAMRLARAAVLYALKR
jgi:hypothetical protein